MVGTLVNGVITRAAYLILKVGPSHWLRLEVTTKQNLNFLEVDGVSLLASQLPWAFVTQKTVTKIKLKHSLMNLLKVMQLA
jgi:hypothetical protein